MQDIRAYLGTKLIIAPVLGNNWYNSLHEAQGDWRALAPYACSKGPDQLPIDKAYFLEKFQNVVCWFILACMLSVVLDEILDEISFLGEI